MGSSLSPDTRDLVIKVIIGVGLAVILIDVALLIAWLIRQPAVREGRARPLFAEKWSLLDAWLAAQVVVVLTLVSAVVAIGIAAIIIVILQGARSIGPSSFSNPGSPVMAVSTLIILLAQNIIMVGVPMFLIHFRYRESLRDLGIKLRPNGTDWKLGVYWGLGLFIFANIVEKVIMFTLVKTIGVAETKHLVDITESATVEGMMKGGMAPILFVAILIGGAIAAPIGEEMFFRGFLYNAAKRRFGVTAGVIISGVVFALVHGGPIAVMAIIPMGMLLAVAYERSGSLWVPILMHITNNGLGIILTELRIGT